MHNSEHPLMKSVEIYAYINKLILVFDYENCWWQQQGKDLGKNCRRPWSQCKLYPDPLGEKTVHIETLHRSLIRSIKFGDC